MYMTTIAVWVLLLYYLYYYDTTCRQLSGTADRLPRKRARHTAIDRFHLYQIYTEEIKIL